MSENPHPQFWDPNHVPVIHDKKRKWSFTNYFTSKWVSRYHCINFNTICSLRTPQRVKSYCRRPFDSGDWELWLLGQILKFCLSLCWLWLLPICNNVWFSMTFTQGAGKYFDYQYSHNIITVFHSLDLNPIHHERVYHQLKISYCWTQALWTAKISPKKKIIQKNSCFRQDTNLRPVQ